MAANMESASRPTDQQITTSVKREYDQLQKKYAGLEAAYRQCIRRLEHAEMSKDQIEQQQTSELMGIAARIRDKIQSLELNQRHSSDDLEDFKQQLKYDLSRQYQDAVEELTTDLDRHRRSYSDLCLQHSILKAEFESLQKLLSDHDEKFRLKLSNQSIQFEAEREALRARIEHLSAELGSALAKAATSENGASGSEDGLKKVFQGQLNEWRQRCERLEIDFQKYRTGKEREVEELKGILEEREEEKHAALAEARRMESELSQEQRRRESTDERYSRLHRELSTLRDDNDVLRTRMELQSEEFSVQVAEKTSQWEKERDEYLHKVDDLTHQTAILKEQVSKFEKLYQHGEIRLSQLEQKLRTEFESDRDSWRNEKITLEAKIKELDHQRHDEDRIHKAEVQDLQLALRKTQWEKEKLAEDLAKIQISSNKESQSKVHTAADIPDLSKLVKRLSDQEEKFIDLSNEFDRYRHKHDQFRDVLEVVNAQIERTVNVDDGAEAQVLIEDLKRKISQMLGSNEPAGQVSDKNAKKEIKLGRKAKVKIANVVE